MDGRRILEAMLWSLVVKGFRRIRGWGEQLVDFIFGYDFFISYSHADGKAYPEELCNALRKLTKKYKVFLDTQVYVSGIDLNAATRRRVRMSRKLVVVARPAALQSKWVEKEVKNCLQAGRDAVVIDVNNSWKTQPKRRRIHLMLCHKLRIAETLATLDGPPNSTVVEQLDNSFHYTRQESIRLRVAAGLAFVLFIIGTVAVTQYIRAEITGRRLVKELRISRTRLAHQLASEAIRLRDDRRSLTAISRLAEARSLDDSPEIRAACLGMSPPIVKFVETTQLGQHSFKKLAVSTDGNLMIGECNTMRIRELPSFWLLDLRNKSQIRIASDTWLNLDRAIFVPGHKDIAIQDGQGKLLRVEPSSGTISVILPEEKSPIFYPPLGLVSNMVMNIAWISGQGLIAVREDGLVLIPELGQKAMAISLTNRGGFTDAAFSADTRRAALLWNDAKTVSVYETRNWKECCRVDFAELARLDPNWRIERVNGELRIDHIALQADGERLLAVDSWGPKYMLVVDVKSDSAKLLRTYRAEDRADILYLELGRFVPGSEWIMGVRDTGTTLIDASGIRPDSPLDSQADSLDRAVWADYPFIVGPDRLGRVSVFDHRTSQLVQVVDAHTSETLSVLMRQDAPTFFTAGSDATIKRWSLTTNSSDHKLGTIPGRLGAHACYSRGAARLAFASERRECFLVDCRTFAERRAISKPPFGWIVNPGYQGPTEWAKNPFHEGLPPPTPSRKKAPAGIWIKEEFMGDISALTFSQDGSYLIAGSTAGHLISVNATNGDFAMTNWHPTLDTYVREIVPLEGNQSFIVRPDEGAITVHSVSTCARLGEFPALGNTELDVAAVVALQPAVLRDGLPKELKQLKGAISFQEVKWFDRNPAGTVWLVQSEAIHNWNPSAGTVESRPLRERIDSQIAAFTPDGKYMIYTLDEQSRATGLAVLELTTGRQVPVRQSNQQPGREDEQIIAIGVRPDGFGVLTLSETGACRQWGGVVPNSLQEATRMTGIQTYNSVETR